MRRVWRWSTGPGGSSAWRITSPTIIPWEMDKTPGLVAGDPVVVLTAISGHYTGLPGAQPPKVEYLVLRLGPRGGVLTRFALPNNDPPRTPFANFAITEIRVQPDGKLYQLGSAPDFGAAIYRYSLRRTDPPHPSPADPRRRRQAAGMNGSRKVAPGVSRYLTPSPPAGISCVSDQATISPRLRWSC
jgi:hypothetical protein